MMHHSALIAAVVTGFGMEHAVALRTKKLLTKVPSKSGPDLDVPEKGIFKKCSEMLFGPCHDGKVFLNGQKDDDKNTGDGGCYTATQKDNTFQDAFKATDEGGECETCCIKPDTDCTADQCDDKGDFTGSCNMQYLSYQTKMEREVTCANCCVKQLKESDQKCTELTGLEAIMYDHCSNENAFFNVESCGDATVPKQAAATKMEHTLIRKSCGNCCRHEPLTKRECFDFKEKDSDPKKMCKTDGVTSSMWEYTLKDHANSKCKDAFAPKPEEKDVDCEKLQCTKAIAACETDKENYQENVCKVTKYRALKEDKKDFTHHCHDKCCKALANNDAKPKEKGSCSS